MQNKITIAHKDFYLSNTYIMGILNVTPDSFSDGGHYNNLMRALQHTENMLNDGASIIDVGGESTRPNYTQISDEEEIARITPIISAIKKEFNVPVSVDTYKAKVAQAAINAGCDLINDIWGLKYDKYMAQVIATANLPCCLMHNRTNTNYNNFIEDVCTDLSETLQIAKNYGIKKENIILDPGIGFAKTYEQNLLLLKEGARLKEFDLPLLLGTSRKSVIGLTLNLPKDEREEGTIVTSILGAMQGYSFFRVHDVKANARALKMLNAITKAGV